MELTPRQINILESIIKEYIDKASPIGSKFLAKRYDFGIKPAALRIEMQKLTDQGYLDQPHISAGRIPTSKGYRFFVGNLEANNSIENCFSDCFEGIEDNFRLIREITKRLAEATSSLALAYILDEDLFWRDGWKDVSDNPEFKISSFWKEFINEAEFLEEDFKSLKEDELKVYIGPGKLHSDNFSLIVSKSQFLNEEQGYLAILGPKRMAYDKNISLINSLIRILDEKGN